MRVSHRFSLQALEPRVLMSADNPVAVAGVAAAPEIEAAAVVETAEDFIQGLVADPAETIDQIFDGLTPLNEVAPDEEKATAANSEERAEASESGKQDSKSAPPIPSLP